MINIVKQERSYDGKYSRHDDKHSEQVVSSSYSRVSPPLNAGLIDKNTQTSVHARSYSEVQNQKGHSRTNSNYTKMDNVSNADLDNMLVSADQSNLFSRIESGQNSSHVLKGNSKSNRHVLRNSNRIGDVEMFTGDNNKLLSSFRSSTGMQHFSNEGNETRVVLSTARLPASKEEQNEHISFDGVGCPAREFQYASHGIPTAKERPQLEAQMLVYKAETGKRSDDTTKVLLVDHLTNLQRSSYLCSSHDKAALSSQQSESQRPSTKVTCAREAEQVVAQINEKYDKLMHELKLYKEAKLKIERSIEDAEDSFEDSNY